MRKCSPPWALPHRLGPLRRFCIPFSVRSAACYPLHRSAPRRRLRDVVRATWQRPIVQTHGSAPPKLRNTFRMPLTRGSALDTSPYRSAPRLRRRGCATWCWPRGNAAVTATAWRRARAWRIPSPSPPPSTSSCPFSHSREEMWVLGGVWAPLTCWKGCAGVVQRRASCAVNARWGLEESAPTLHFCPAGNSSHQQMYQ